MQGGEKNDFLGKRTHARTHKIDKQGKIMLAMALIAWQNSNMKIIITSQHPANPLNTPCVYMWRRGDEVLYIGATCNVFKRVKYHDKIGRCEPIQPEDYIEVVFYLEGKWMGVYELENQLHEKHKPKYSMPNNGKYQNEPAQERKCRVVECMWCKQMFMQKRYWQKVCTAECKTKHTTGYVKRTLEHMIKTKN